MVLTEEEKIKEEQNYIRYHIVKNPSECPRMIYKIGYGDICCNNNDDIILCDKKYTKFPRDCPLEKMIRKN